MQRRRYLSLAGGAVAVGLAGCTGDGSGNGFETITVGGEDVPLAPVDRTHEWYQNQEPPRFVDARGPTQYERSHITDAVSSPARAVEDWSESRPADPTDDWAKDDRVVCYCGCPHHLSSLRAGELISAGYERVYAIDEGFFEWKERGYPVTGDGEPAASYVIEGRAGTDAAGEYAWASHGSSDQQEAAPIGDDGSYRLELHFGDLAPSAPIHLRTPAYEFTAPLGEVTAGVVSGPPGGN